ncbi:MAG TPA: serine hydrolase domain-containing protein [Ardenticatenaceae bacterium]|nr:serine hydrolase domain-containing protein [Ardenticatenaceae bacterium]
MTGRWARSFRWLCALAVLGVLACLIVPSAQSSGLPARGAVGVLGSGPEDAAELEAFLDGFLTAQLEAHHIPGASVAVVKDGELFLAKGYGYADLERGRPVVAAETLFRVASISKLFTATAVMQLVEQGKLDLNADVNGYLTAFQVPATYPEPITLAHLLTHTAGFEDRFINGANNARSVETLPPLEQALADTMPARVRPPGTLSAYSNYGVALAGYVVERVAGVPYEQYVAEHIFEPLGMQRSSFGQPLPPDMMADLAVGYTYAGGADEPGEFEWLVLRPSAALSTTATDIARFMAAHLQNGRLGEARILQEATALDMHRQHFAHDPRVSGWAYGFHEVNLNGLRTIGHSGALSRYHSRLELLPDSGAGLFVAYNSADAEPAHAELLQAFLDRYYPLPPAPPPQPLPDSATRATRHSGSYWATRNAYTTLEKLGGLIYPVTVRALGNGSLVVDGKVWVEVEPSVFRERDGQEVMVFLEDERGDVTSMLLGDSPDRAFIKLAWYQAPSLHFGLLALCSVAFLSAALAPLVWRRRPGTAAASGRLARAARWLVAVTATLHLAFVVILVVALGDPELVLYDIPPFLVVALVLASAGTGLTALLLVLAPFVWRERSWGRVARVHYVVVTLAAVTFVWFLTYWNLLGFRY